MRDAPRLALVVSRFNQAVTDRLLQGARSAAAERGAVCGEDDVFSVPGAFELPVVASKAAALQRYRGVVCLGAVIRGQTPHFDYICRETAAGLQRVALESGKPVGFGVLTTDTIEQALARAGGEVGNKGFEAVVTVLETLAVLERMPGG